MCKIFASLYKTLHLLYLQNTCKSMHAGSAWEDTYLKEYGAELQTKMCDAWELVRQNVVKAQKKQKKFFDQKSQVGNYRAG